MGGWDKRKGGRKEERNKGGRREERRQAEREGNKVGILRGKKGMERAREF